MKDTFVVMVPDMEDLGPSQMPKKPLPEYLFQNFLTKFPFFYLAENPFRFTIFGKNIVVSKANLLKSLCRQTVSPIQKDKNITNHLVSTIKGQRSLTPLP